MADNSPRWSRKYTDAQREAFLRAVVLEDVPVAEAVRRAARGELGIPAFKVHGRYAYQLVGKLRESFEVDNPEALQRGTKKSLKTAHVANLRALRALPFDADPTERTRLAKAVHDSLKLLDAPAKPAAKGTARASGGEDTPVAQSDPTLEGLLKLAPEPPDEPKAA